MKWQRTPAGDWTAPAYCGGTYLFRLEPGGWWACHSTFKGPLSGFYAGRWPSIVSAVRWAQKREKRKGKLWRE